MNRYTKQEQVMFDTVPHMRGDEPVRQKAVVLVHIRSPHAWG